MKVVVNRSTLMMIKQAKFLCTVLYNFLIDVGRVFPNNSILYLSSYVREKLPHNSIFSLSGYVEDKLGTWIPLGLHLDQSNYMGWVLKPSAHNSINVLSR